MKKRLVAILLTVIMALGVVACGNGAGTTNSTKQEDMVVEATPDEKEDGSANKVVEETEEEQIISSETQETLTEEEKTNLIRQTADTILKAYQNLDAEALKPYLDEETFEGIRTRMDQIKANPEDVEFWNNTVGTMIYLPDSDILLAKSIDYTYASWYTDCWKENKEIPEANSEDFSNEYLNEIYEKYYKDAPYVATNQFSDEIGVNLKEDGSITFYPNSVSGSSECEKLFEAIELNYANIRSYILLGNAEYLSLGYDYIAEEDRIPDYEVFLSRDIDAIIQVIEEKGIFAEAESSSFAHNYQVYYVKEENRVLVQQFLNDECEVYRDLNSVIMVMPACLTKRFTQYTEEDIARIEEMDLDVAEISVMLDFVDSEGYIIFNDLAENAVAHGVMEEELMFDF